MQYELINPSDPYTFIAASPEVAALTAFVLGEGMYGAKAKNGDASARVPSFVLGGASEWYEETFGRSVDDGLSALRTELGESLISLVYGNFDDRSRYETILKSIPDPEKREAYVKEWQNKISSANNIGGRAHQIGKALLQQPVH